MHVQRLSDSLLSARSTNVEYQPGTSSRDVALIERAHVFY